MRFIEDKMGCVSGKPDINDKHPNIFQVTNVNENRELKSPGQLEITDSDLILHQKGKTPLVWPLRTLRKYGYDCEIFTFECGRRCPTGQGIFAFQCKRAERLFSTVQQNISRNVVGADEIANESNVGGQTATTIRRSQSTNQDGYLTPNVHNLRIYPIVRPGSVSVISGGPLSPPPVVETNSEHNNNNNKRDSVISNALFSFNGSQEQEESQLIVERPNYVNFNGETSCQSDTQPETPTISGHVYMNFDEQQQRDGTTAAESSPEFAQLNHCYVNLDIEDLQDRIRKVRDNDQYENLDLEAIPELKFLMSGQYGNADHLAQQLERIRAGKIVGGELNKNNDNENTEEQTNTKKEEENDEDVVFAPKFNYAKLAFEVKDDDCVKKEAWQGHNQTVPDDSPNRPKESYATIDFYRTNAISQLVNPSIGDEEGVRRTRHNSSINNNNNINNEVANTRTSSCFSD